MKPLVVILRPIPEPAEKLLKPKCRLRVNRGNRILPPNQLKRFVSGADAILSLLTDKIDEAVLAAAGKNLKVVANYAVGYDNIDRAAAARRSIVVSNTPDVLSHAVAEHTIALALAVSRRIVEADTFTRKGHFTQWEPKGFLGPSLMGKTLGVIGLGRIGSAVAEIAHSGFGMDVIYYDIERSLNFERQVEANYHTLPILLKSADVVSLHVPLLPSTKHLIGPAEFRLMKKTAILVNTARGPIIDEQALVKALRTEQILGAGLDVYEHEPKLSPGLTNLANVVLTPHIASATIESRTQMSELAAKNILAVLAGKKPLTPVIWKK